MREGLLTAPAATLSIAQAPGVDENYGMYSLHEQAKNAYVRVIVLCNDGGCGWADDARPVATKIRIRTRAEKMHSINGTTVISAIIGTCGCQNLGSADTYSYQPSLAPCSVCRVLVMLWRYLTTI